ncbi:MAG: PQQ-dependent sugar dehydrogenase [Planctomycetes bacterium]|nr:PQQ-dependent sugar dehydrogenase [Planctomycetota bacterium]
MAFAPDGRLFLTERMSGNIRVFANGSLDPTPWATVSVFHGGSYAEQGLLGIAVDPDFLNNRFVYVFHTKAGGGENVIARLQEVSGRGSNYTVLTPPGAINSVTLHNGGPLIFGQDGTLYAATGDSYNTTLPQDPQSWNGKVLRFEVPNLTIPASNPFPGSPVYSLGHRNQFGLSIHPVTGDLFQTENGGALMDEVNRIVPGGNYGWPTIEGREVTPDPAFVDPLEWYQPTAALTGCDFFSGENYPVTYQNAWFFTDYNHNRIRVMTFDATGQIVLGQTLFDDLPGAGYGIKMGPDGNLWYLTHDYGGYGADELGRYTHQNEPMPSAHVTAVANRAVGGSITIGVHAHNGDLVVPWLSWSHYSTPFPTPFGDQWIPVDVVLPSMVVAADDRAYLGLSIPNVSSVIGRAAYVQAVSYTVSTGSIQATNPAKHVLR